MERKWPVFVGLLVIACVLSIGGNSVAQQSMPLRVTLIFDIGGIGDGGFNDSAYRGMERAVSELGVKVQYVEPSGSLDREIALSTAVSSDADMIIGVGFVFSDRLTELAALSPDKKFICVDYNVRHDHQGRILPLPKNLAALVFREEEGSYLVGAIAALKSRTGKIGFLGGMNGPLIRRFQAGYLAGAKAVRPDIRVVSQFAGLTGKAFNNPQKGYLMADRMYGEGADIIYHAAGVTGEGLFQAAKKRHLSAIGVDIDQSVQAPGLVLTSMTKHVDVAVFESVKVFAAGNFSGGVKSFGLKENGVGFVYDDYNKGMISENIHDRIQGIREQIVSGELKVPVLDQSKPMLLRNDLRDVLNQLKEEAAEVLEKLDADLKLGAKMLSGTALNSERARSVLKRIYGLNPYLIDCSTVGNQGVIQAIEPEGFKEFEGANIASQVHWSKLAKTGNPVLSGYFRSVQGVAAVAFHYPVFLSDNRLAGSVSALLEPEKLLAGIIEPVSSNLPVDIFLMQTDGLMIYDVDANQIGRNVFQDPLYQPFPELIELARKVAVTKKGMGEYRFYREGSGEPVNKLAYWKTIHKHGTEWRIVITCAKDSIEPAS
jgi:basic membrane protein A